MTDNLFVYGTLHSSIGHPMHQVLVEYAQFIGMGTVQGRLFNIGNYPGLVLSKDIHSNGSPAQHQTPHHYPVLGEVYALAPDTCGKALALLDEYETCGPGQVETEYRRESISIQLEENAHLVQAWAYLYNRTSASLTEITSGDYAAFVHHLQS